MRQIWMDIFNFFYVFFLSFTSSKRTSYNVFLVLFVFFFFVRLDHTFEQRRLNVDRLLHHQHIFSWKNSMAWQLHLHSKKERDSISVNTGEKKQNTNLWFLRKNCIVSFAKEVFLILLRFLFIEFVFQLTEENRMSSAIHC